ncbi:hypothetical protein [Novosphingobium sp.]|uniref:hypothetical protein n=1 Tax=Novosphingobium sp. TaxID=1874826 RepID=UPI00286C5905|nr:hypothetical protein [Novosphingobium sp.]
MTMMLAPDLLDRRALAQLALIDPNGQPFEGGVEIANDDLRTVNKTGGRIALLGAPGFAAYTAAFAQVPGAPATGSKSIAIDLNPASRAVMPRRITLKLPRSADPAQADTAESIFRPVIVVFSASPRTAMQPGACILRASVRRASDGAMVENAVVRARSADGKHTAWALTDPAGEAALVFPALPVSFAGAGGTPSPAIACAVVVHADPASARFANPETLAGARAAAAARRTGHVDPDALMAAHPADFAGAQTVSIAASSQPAVTLNWTAP